jgi:hypothetical protein
MRHIETALATSTSPATTTSVSTTMATSASSTTVPTPTPTTTPGTTSTAWAPGKIAGVTVGSIAGIAFIILPIGFVWRRKQRAPAPVRSPEEPGPDSLGPGSTTKDVPTVTEAKVEDDVKELPSPTGTKPKAREIDSSQLQEVDGAQAREIDGSQVQEADGAQVLEMDASHIPEIDSREV